MALADLIAALEADVERQAADILAAGRAEAERIRQTTADALARRRAERLAQHEQQSRHALARQLTQAEARLRGELLAAREALLTSVLAGARTQLAGLQKGEVYQRLLADELLDALSYADPHGAVVRCPPALAAPARAALNSGHESVMVEEDAAMGAGFRVIAEGGRVEVDQTLETRLRRLEPRLRIEIVQRVERVATAGEDGHALG